jgi:cobalt-zinc-cadmium efflux system protein
MSADMSIDHHDHDHSGHDHASHAGHTHAPASFGTAFAIGTALNAGFVVLEAVFGLIANSTALLADAGHNLSDVFGLLVAWGASTLATRAPSQRYTYGLRSSSILAALANAVVLLIAVGAIVWEAVRHLYAPEPVAGGTVMAVAAVGIVINGATAMLFLRGKDGDLNIRGAYLHMLVDAGVSLGVVVTGALVALTGVMRLDPLVSLVIAGLIVWGTWSLLRQSTAMALHAVPPHIDPTAVRAHLASLPGVTGVHDLHIWSMSTTETALTSHLVMPKGHPGDAFLAQVAGSLREKFKIAHATLQIELADAAACAHEPDEVL